MRLLLSCLILLFLVVGSFGQEKEPEKEKEKEPVKEKEKEPEKEKEKEKEMDNSCAGNPTKKELKDCCIMPLPSVDAFTKCYTEFKEQSEKTASMKIKHGCCISECTFNETQIYKGNGIIDREALTNILLNVTGADWNETMSEVLMKCFDEVPFNFHKFAEMYSSPQAFPTEKICHPISGFLLSCIHDNAFRKCPTSKYTKNAECDQLKEYAEKCPVLFT